MSSNDTPGPQRGTRLGRTVRHRWREAVALGILFAAVFSAPIIAHVRPLYEATAWLQVDPPISSPFAAAPRESDLSLASQVLLIGSPDVLSAALTERNVMAITREQPSTDPESELRRRLRVVSEPGTSIVRVSIEHPSPTVAAVLVNAIVDTYLKIARTWTSTEGQAQIQKLKELELGVRRDVAEKREIVQQLMSQSSAADVRRLKARLFDAELDALAARARLEALKHREGGDEAEARQRIADQEIEAETAANLMKALQGRLAASQRSGPDSLDLQFAREDLATARKLLSQATLALRQAEFEARNSARLSLISKARPSSRPARDSRIGLIGVATAAGFLIAFGLMYVLEARAGNLSHRPPTNAGGLIA